MTNNSIISCKRALTRKRRSGRRDGVNRAWARSSRWQTSEGSHLMILYVLLTRCESFSPFFVALACYGHSPRSRWLAEVWTSRWMSRLRLGTSQNSRVLLSPSRGCKLSYCAGWSNKNPAILDHRTTSSQCFIWLCLTLQECNVVNSV